MPFTPLPDIHNLCELTHARIPLPLRLHCSGPGEREIAARLAGVSSITVQKQVREFVATLLNVLRHVRDAMAESQGK